MTWIFCVFNFCSNRSKTWHIILQVLGTTPPISLRFHKTTCLRNHFSVLLTACCFWFIWPIRTFFFTITFPPGWDAVAIVTSEIWLGTSFLCCKEKKKKEKKVLSMNISRAEDLHCIQSHWHDTDGPVLKGFTSHSTLLLRDRVEQVSKTDVSSS